MEHLRINGAYWGLTTLDLLGKLETVDVDEVVSWVMDCQHESDFALFDKLNVLDLEKVTIYITRLQNQDGSFSGDIWGEVDTRFSYIALCCLSLLHRLDKINVEEAVSYIISCKNLDGRFGCTPGGESHAGQVFCCVSALAITGSLHHIDKDLLGWWLCERQVKSGGLNGRPEKLPDQNRPLNSQNLADYLQKFNLKKAAIQKALDGLADTRQISFKEYVKQKIYIAQQDQFDIPNNKELNRMKEENASLQQQLQEQRKAIGEVEGGRTMQLRIIGIAR